MDPTSVVVDRRCDLGHHPAQLGAVSCREARDHREVGRPGDLARGLGSHPLATRIGTGLATVCLVGAATAIAGPIGFIGLMVPHIVRPFTGPRTAPLLLISTFTGAGLVLTADILSRIVLWPGEIPVGIVSAALGALVMLVLLRRRR
ncbi:FecCD family ABC transporter permease [Corynebacterium striatum]|uniref:FecCD family ABC transporter permease n=1 Tax=Corynebacterium striatum TaxID=43770 RepID=UPI003B5B2F03